MEEDQERSKDCCVQGTGDKNGLYETVPEKEGVRARAGSLAKRESTDCVRPGQLAKLGGMVPAQKLAHIPLRTNAFFFLFH